MDITTQRRCLGTLAGGLFAGTVAVVAWSFSGIDSPSEVRGENRSRNVGPAIAETDMPSFDDRIAAQSLRAPLYDAPAPPPAARPPQPPPKPAPRPKTGLDVTLVGTIIESNQSFAILADSMGKFDIKGIGESLELSPQGMTVESIEAEQVTLEYQGRQSTVQLDRSRKKAAAGGERANNRRRNR